MIDYRGDGKVAELEPEFGQPSKRQKQIAEQTAAKLLHGATVIWEQ
jgi:hypothetical protein